MLWPSVKSLLSELFSDKVLKNNLTKQIFRTETLFILRWDIRTLVKKTSLHLECKKNPYVKIKK